MIEERPDTEVWEPWVPEVGQRVVVQLNPECQQHMELHHETVIQSVQGIEGYVEWTDDRRWPGHPIKVAFCTPFEALHFSGRRRLCEGGVFAALELAPLTPPPDPEAGRGAP